jgi:hypothetical protein
LVEELADFDDVVPTPDPRHADGQKPEPKRADGDADLDETLVKADQRTESLAVLSAEDLSPEWRSPSAVLCMPGRNQLDRAGAQMLAQLLRKHGLGARVDGSEILGGDRVLPAEAPEIRVVCVSFLDTTAPVHVRFATRRLRRRFPKAQVLVGAWGLSREEADSLCAASRSDGCATRLGEALQFCVDAARGSAEPEARQPALPPRAAAA